MIWYYDAKDWKITRRAIATQLTQSESVDVGSWHSKPVEGKMLETREIPGTAIVEGEIPQSQQAWADAIEPNMPWAEAHFLERISGIPHNPPPSHVDWPFAHAQHQTVEGDKFSHTYPERMWPKRPIWDRSRPHVVTGIEPRQGVRFEYGDLGDIIELLKQDLMTRQAWLPIYFPEDVGLSIRHPGERVPCSLGYHFLFRDRFLHMKYVIRSCDFVRHWADDTYMAGRLLQHVAQQIGQEPGFLTATFFSLHSMVGDDYAIKRRLESGEW